MTLITPLKMNGTLPSLRLSAFNSMKFRFWSFIAMFLLVFVHGYNLHDRYMQPWTTPDDGLSFTSFTEYFLANGIFRFRIPMLFIISGYLFAMHDYRPYRERTKKRLRTLLIPYLLWSAIGFGYTWLLEIFPLTREIVGASNVVRIDDHRVYLHDYHWWEMTVRWILLPVPYQLWFIRVLLIYNIAYPPIRWLVTHRIASRIFFPLVFLMWFGTFNAGLIEGEGLLFFSLGIWMQKSQFNIDIPARWMNPVVWGAVFIGMSALKTWIALTVGLMPAQATVPVLSSMHKIVVFSGLITTWYGLNPLVRWCMEKPWFVWLSAFSFMIYALHAPLVAFLIDPFFSLTGYISGYRLITFVILPLLVISFAVLTGAVLRKLIPGFYSILTGGRGLQV